MNTQTENDPNKFGNLSQEYVTARRGYPKEVYDYLHEYSGVKSGAALDLGCGTGLGTKELQAEGFEVTGADIDEKMVKTAETENPEISFVVAPANTLPFSNESFDIVTAFTSFHWFENEQSINEIKRVLKPDGTLFIALKQNRQDSQKTEFFTNSRVIFKKYAGEKYNSARNSDPETFIENHGFKNVEEKSIYFKENYSVDDFLTLTKSYSFWNIIPEDQRPTFLAELRELCEKSFPDGTVVLEREVYIVVGKK